MFVVVFFKIVPFLYIGIFLNFLILEINGLRFFMSKFEKKIVFDYL